MLKEKKLAVRNARRPGPEATIEALGLRLGLDRFLILLPVHPIGRIRQHIVECLALVGVICERVAEGDLLRVMAGHEHVGFADAERLPVDLLTEKFDADARVESVHLLLGERQHTAGAARRVIDGADDADASQGCMIVRQQKFDDEADDLAGGVMLTGGLVGDFREAAD